MGSEAGGVLEEKPRRVPRDHFSARQRQSCLFSHGGSIRWGHKKGLEALDALMALTDPVMLNIQ